MANLFTILALTVLACVSAKECDTVCPAVYEPVCGSDRKVHSNGCELEVAACTTNQEITVKDMSFCEEKDCDVMCTMDYSPVCGSDSKVYSNACQMRVAACQTNERISRRPMRLCKPTRGADCDMMCTMDYTPVCGTDGETYSNLCVLNVKQCKTDGAVKMASEGECSQKKDCDLMCTMDYSPVCGSDGKVHSNGCQMKVAACQANKRISRRPMRLCKPTRGAGYECTGEYAPVCGTDGRTYSNQCYLDQETVRTYGRVKLAYNGEC